MTYDNNGPVYSALNGKPNCWYCDSNAPFGIGSSSVSPEVCADNGGWTSLATAQAAGCYDASVCFCCGGPGEYLGNYATSNCGEDGNAQTYTQQCADMGGHTIVSVNFPC